MEPTRYGTGFRGYIGDIDVTIQIDPTKPVSGNLRGTLAGAAATVASGYLLKSGIITNVAQYFCAGTEMCGQVESALFLLALAGVGGIVNYAVTHFSQVKKLEELYQMLPSVYQEYPEDKDKPAGNLNNLKK